MPLVDFREGKAKARERPRMSPATESVDLGLDLSIGHRPCPYTLENKKTKEI